MEFGIRFTSYDSHLLTKIEGSSEADRARSIGRDENAQNTKTDTQNTGEDSQTEHNCKGREATGCGGGYFDRKLARRERRREARAGGREDGVGGSRGDSPPARPPPASTHPLSTHPCLRTARSSALRSNSHSCAF